MLTDEKFAWIKKNLRRGDRKKINKLLPHIDYSVIVAVLNGGLLGKNGPEIIEATVGFLQQRLQEERAERAKFAAMLEEDVVAV